MWHVLIGWCKLKGLHPILIEFIFIYIYIYLSFLAVGGIQWWYQCHSCNVPKQFEWGDLVSLPCCFHSLMCSGIPFIMISVERFPCPAQTCLDEGNWTGSAPLPNFHNFHVYAQTNFYCQTPKKKKKKIKYAYNICF